MLGKGLASLIPKKRDDQPPQPKGESFFTLKSEQPTIRSQETEENFPSQKLPPPTEPGLRPQSEPVGEGRQVESLDEASVLKKRKFSSLQEAIFHIEVDKIKPNPHQPRRDFNEEGLKELAASIREFGILQPLVVSKTEKETDFGTEVEYQLIAGERRLMAAKMLGLERVPAIIRKIDKKSEQLEMAVIENLQRADLNPIETARAYAKLQDEFGLTQREIASRLGKSRETIANTLRLLNLPSEIQDALAKNQINESQARLLLIIEDPIQQQNLFKEILNNNLSVRELRQKIRKPNSSNLSVAQSSEKTLDPEIINLREKLTELLAAPVEIQKTGKSGKIIITFYSPEEIQGIIDKISPGNKQD